MLRYETLFLGKTEMTEDDISALERVLDKLISSANGRMSSFDKWGKLRLAFPIDKQTHGFYMLARYEVPKTSVAATLTDLDEFLRIKCHELVLRHVNVRLAANAPVDYSRPEALDVARSGSIDAFIKDNKIDNLLSSVDAAQDEIDDQEN